MEISGRVAVLCYCGYKSSTALHWVEHSTVVPYLLTADTSPDVCKASICEVPPLPAKLWFQTIQCFKSIFKGTCKGKSTAVHFIAVSHYLLQLYWLEMFIGAELMPISNCWKLGQVEGCVYAWIHRSWVVSALHITASFSICVPSCQVIVGSFDAPVTGQLTYRYLEVQTSPPPLPGTKPGLYILSLC